MPKIAYLLWLLVICGAGLAITANAPLQSVGISIWSLGVAIQIILGIYLFMPKILSLITQSARPPRVIASIQDETRATRIEHSLGRQSLPELEEIEDNTQKSGEIDGDRRGVVVKQIKPRVRPQAIDFLSKIWHLFEAPLEDPPESLKPQIAASCPSSEEPKIPDGDPETPDSC